MKIRPSTALDADGISELHVTAFGDEEGEEVATLVTELFNDLSAEPLFSLVAVENHRIIGHILFTKATVSQTDENISAQLLAPLAVLPGEQNKGIGTMLIEKGLVELRANGVDLVFVLGHPEYYPRSGFCPAGKYGLNAPYPVPVKNEDAWMVKELSSGFIGRVKGKVKCANALDHPQYWRE